MFKMTYPTNPVTGVQHVPYWLVGQWCGALQHTDPWKWEWMPVQGNNLCWFCRNLLRWRAEQMMEVAEDFGLDYKVAS